MSRAAKIMAGLILLLLPAFGQAQVPVALAPSMHPQFLDATGKVLSGGFVYTYQAGTTIRQDSYTDSTGVTINAWPIPLDATGSPSNGSTQTGIWLSNNTYKICGYNSALVQQWCTDNVSAYQILNGVQNIVFGSVTSDPTGAAGMLGYRSDIPCFRGYTTFWDCFVTLTGIQTLTNKTLTSPTINTPTITGGATTGSPSLNGTLQPNGPGTYISVANSVTGTVNNRLTKLVGGLAQFMATTDAAGSIGITVAGGGGVGTTATIQQSGQAGCFFDNATTAGDYVQISTLTGGSCHDVGPTFPLIGQAVGRVLSTNVFNAALVIQVDLFSPEILGGSIGATTGCTAIGPVGIGNNNTLQTLLSCVIPANALAAGNMLEVDVSGINSTASAMNITIVASLGGGTACVAGTGTSTSISANQPWNASFKFAVMTAGAGGTGNWACEYFSSTAGGGVGGPNGVVGAPTIAINTTIPNTLLIQEQMTVTNAGNSVTGQLLKSVIF